MSNAVKNTLLALSALPLLAKLPYLWNTWHYSPLERGGWILWVCALGSIVLCEAVRQTYAHAPQPARRPCSILFALALFFLLAGWFIFNFTPFRVHAFSIFFGIGILFVSAGWRWGTQVLMSQIPSLFFAILGTTSVSYWGGFYLNLNLNGALEYLLAKMAVSWIFLGIWTLFVFKNKFYPKPQHLLFCLAACAVLGVSQVRSTSVADGSPLRLETNEFQAGQWIGRAEEVTPADIKFFSGCTWVGRFLYFNRDSSLSILALEVADITNLHPMPICLKSSGASILSNEQIYLTVNGQPIQVNELEIELNSIPSFAYSIYSNDSVSTGDFAKFRLLRKDHKTWHHYQLVTPAHAGREAARQRVESFLNTFAVPNP